MKPIAEIADAMGIDPSLVIPYGRYKAKLALEAIKADAPQGKPDRGNGNHSDAAG